MKWGEAERVGVGSVLGKQYAKVGTINLVLLVFFAVLDGLLKGFGPVFHFEYGLLVVLLTLVATHGADFGRRLAGLVRAEKGTSMKISSLERRFEGRSVARDG